ncbi:MAG: hypothetical protein IKS20_04855 [Victivallales bacterium]|nr:hypothetical protein [Victivallales bacterium]
MLNNIILYAVLLIAAIGAIVGWQNSKKGATWGQPMTVICAIIAICMGLFLAYSNSSSTAANKSAMARENAFRVAKVTVLGNKVKELCPGKKAIVVIDPNVDPLKDVEMQTWKTMFELSDDDFVKPDVPQPPAGTPPEMVMVEPMEEWFRQAMLEKMLKGKKYDLIIFTTSLPRDIKQAKGVFTAPFLKDAKVVLASGNLFGCAGFINAGTAVAAVTSSPTAVYDDKPAPKETQAAFDKRYILITKDNLQALMKSNGDIFGLQTSN